MFLIFRVQNETEALALANDTSFGLASVIFSEDLRRAQSLARQIEAGMVFINHLRSRSGGRLMCGLTLQEADAIVKGAFNRANRSMTYTQVFT